jgi:hypothetical protein
MAESQMRTQAQAEVRDRIAEIEEELQKLSKFREFAATYDYQYRMADAKEDALRQERDSLKEILGDL